MKLFLLYSPVAFARPTIEVDPSVGSGGGTDILAFLFLIFFFWVIWSVMTEALREAWKSTATAWRRFVGREASRLGYDVKDERED